MPAPLIHVGYQKSGTSYLQAHVFNNAEKGFASRWTIGTGDAIEQFVLKHPRRFDPAQARAQFDAAHASAPEGTIPVLSHEDLSGHPVLARYYGFATAERLHATFPDGKIVIGIREQRAMLRSLYGQYVRQDGEWPIEAFLGRGELPPGFQTICRLDHFEYHLLADFYAELFGKENVLVLPIELLRRDPIAYEQAIHDFAGTGARADKAHIKENIGSGAFTLALNRILNTFAKRPPDWDGRHLNQSRASRLKRTTLRDLDKYIPKSWHRKFDLRLKKFIAQRVRGYYAESNRIMAERYDLPLEEYGYDVGPTGALPREEASFSQSASEKIDSR